MPVALGVSVWVPLTFSLPVKPPALVALCDAVQLVAPLDDQVIVVDLFSTIDVSANVRVGAAGGVVAAGVTVRVTVLTADEVPPAFAQVSLYVSVPAALGVSVCDPLAFSAPLQSPEAVQPVVPTDDQVMVTEPPTVTEDADRVSVGAAGGICASAASA